MNNVLKCFVAVALPAAKSQILEYLKANDNCAYTYNELSTILNIPVMTAKSACRYLEDDNLIISHNPKCSRKKLVYKYAEDAAFVRRYGANAHIKRKAIEKQIRKIVEDTPGINASSIYQRVRDYYFEIDKNAVNEALKSMVAANRLVVVEQQRGSVICRKHYLAN